MYRKIVAAAAALWFAAAGVGFARQTPAPAAPAAGVPLETYGRLPGLEEVELSPKGDRLAYITVVGDARQLHVQTLDGTKLGKVGLGAQKVRDVEWGDNDHLLITTSSTGRVCKLCDKGENLIVQSYNVTTRKFAVLLGTSNGAVGAFVGGAPTVRLVNGRDIVLVYGYVERDGAWWPAQFKVNLDTGHGELFDLNFGVMDDKGYIVAASEYYHDNGRWRLVTWEGRRIKELVIVPQVDYDPPELLGYGRTPNTVLMSSLGEEGRVYHEVDLATGARTSMPMPKPGFSPMFDPRTDAFLGYAGLVGNDYGYEYLDAELNVAWKRVADAFKGRNPRIVSWTNDRKKAVIRTDGPSETGTFFLMDFAANQATEIGPQYPTIRPDQVHEVRYVTYAAADGLEIPAYLTLPKGRDPKGLPLIVMPHGGPHIRDTPEFDWWSQALASRGYAVLRPQFRGSDGYGAAHMRAGFGEWGKKMQTDLSDGVRWLSGQGIVDPKRVCIMGASYGGYAAMAAPALEPGVYRCAVSVSGVSDLRRMLAEEKRQAGASDTLVVRFWRRFMGASSINDGSLAAISPTSLADRYSAPILLIHGKDDLVVPYNQSEVLARALGRAGKPYEFVTLAGEDHWLSRSATRSQMLSAAVTFVEKHNPAY